MRRLLLPFLLLFAVMVSWAQTPIAIAPVPPLIKFSGTLVNTQGAVGAIFALYAEQTGGAPLWLETQNVTPDANGRYVVYLGANHANGVPLDLFASAEARWLGVQPEGQAEQARVQLVSVPYALKAAKAADADTLGGQPLSAFVLASNAGTTTGTGSSTVTANAGSGGVLALASPQSPPTYPVNTSGAAFNTYLARFTSSTDIEPSLIYDSGSAIGIGTTAPQAVLHVVSPTAVAGMIDAYSGASTTSLGALPMVSRAARGTLGSPSAVKTNDYLGGLGARGYTGTTFTGGWRAAVLLRADQDWTDTAQGTNITFGVTAPNTVAQKQVMWLTSGGALGIGINTPDSLLTVAGPIHSTTGGFKFPDNTTQTSAGIAQAAADARYLAPANADSKYVKLSGGNIISGDQAVTGDVSATTFHGNGSALTGMNTNTDIQALLVRVSALEGQIPTLQAQVAQLPYLQNGLPAGSTFWAKRFGGTGDDYTRTVAADSSGNVYLAGYFTSASIDLGGGPLANASSYDEIFLAKFDPNGTHLWSKSFGGTASQTVNSVAADVNGNVYVAGSFYSPTIDFGGGPLVNAGGTAGTYDNFLAKFDTNGNYLWAKSFGGTGNDVGYGVAVDSSGNAYFTGAFNSQTITFGTGVLLNIGGLSGTNDIFLAKFNPSGTCLWAKNIGGTGTDTGFSVAVDGSGNAYITGGFNSASIDFGGGALTNAGTGTTQDIFLAKFDTNGNYLWAKSFGGTGSDYGWSVAVDTGGNVALTGYFASPSINFGGGPLTNAGIGTTSDTFVAKFDASGSYLWAKSFGGAGLEYGQNVVVDSSGNVYFTGEFSSPSIDFGGGALGNTGGGYDIFLAKLDANGNYVWAKNIGGTSSDYGYGLAMGNNGSLYLAGYFQSPSIDFGGGPLTNAGGNDVFLTKLKR